MLELGVSFGIGGMLALLIAGLLVGVIGGLLGIGGGVIAVPLLLELLAGSGMAETDRTAVAVGTAQAAILLTAISAARAHATAGSIDRPLLRAWAPAVLGGAVLGLALAPAVPPTVAQASFGAVALLLGLQLLVGGRRQLAESPPPPPLGWLPPGLVGLLASALGVGAGTLSGPVLGLLGVPLGRAVGAGAAFNLVVAIPATLGFMAIGLGRPGLPADAIGYVSLGATALLAAPAMLVAPAAARLAGRLPLPLLRRLFALCLLAIAARVLWRVAGG